MTLIEAGSDQNRGSDFPLVAAISVVVVALLGCFSRPPPARGRCSGDPSTIVALFCFYAAGPPGSQHLVLPPPPVNATQSTRTGRHAVVFRDSQGRTKHGAISIPARSPAPVQDSAGGPDRRRRGAEGQARRVRAQPQGRGGCRGRRGRGGGLGRVDGRVGENEGGGGGGKWESVSLSLGSWLPCVAVGLRACVCVLVTYSGSNR